MASNPSERLWEQSMSNGNHEDSEIAEERQESLRRQMAYTTVNLDPASPM